MLRGYIEAAMEHAQYEILPDDGTFYGELPDCQGVWANEPTLAACQRMLASVLEGWILLRVRLGLDLPVVDGHEITVGDELAA